MDEVHTFRRLATTVGARIKLDVAAEVWVEIDEEAFHIVLSNLLENAVKYGGSIPEVTVTLRCPNTQATLEVQDNGHGIADEDIPLVFNRFYRGGDEMTRTAQGTGLGLYLVDQIVSAHKGAATVASTGAGGTTMRITLPNAEVWEDRA